MQNTKLVKQWAKHNNVNLDTISFYENIEGEQPDSEFGYCDISNIEGNIYWCICRLNNGDVFEFQVLDSLIGGALGKAAGAF